MADLKVREKNEKMANQRLEAMPNKRVQFLLRGLTSKCWVRNVTVTARPHQCCALARIARRNCASSHS